MKIAYLTTQYPAVSHSFIRREIRAVERPGTEVLRFSIRAAPADLPDPADREEEARTTVVLGQGARRLITAFAGAMFRHPLRTMRALGCAWRMSRRGGRGLVHHGAYLLEAAWLARRLRAQGARHLHVHFGTNPAAVARLCRLLGGPPYSFTVHGPDEFDNPVGLDLHGKIRDASLCVGISSFGRSQLMRWSDYRDWGKIAVVRCGVDDAFRGDRSDRPPPDVPRLCCVARLSAQKGLPLLLDAAASLRRENVDFRLVLVGDGEMRAEIEARIAALNLEQNVVITGWASATDVREHLLAARAMVLPSFAEGLPVVIMEALALGRPVIASAIAGTPELVDASCGWLVPAGDSEALARAMRGALAAPVEQLTAMGAEGRRRVLERHDASANGDALLRMIEGLRA